MCVASAFALVVENGREDREARPLATQIDRLARLAGFGLDQVSVEGHRMTLDADIFEALDLGHVRSLIGFDHRAVRERIERLPWIKSAHVTQVFPDAVTIQLTERKPFAVWQRAGRESLIDASGRVLSAIPAGANPELPRVAGEGAAVEAASILALVRRYPGLAARLAVAERIGDRRWTLRLADGPDIHLAADRASESLAELMTTRQGRRLVGRDVAEIDLRVAGRVTVRDAVVRDVGGDRLPSRRAPARSGEE